MIIQMQAPAEKQPSSCFDQHHGPGPAQQNHTLVTPNIDSWGTPDNSGCLSLHLPHEKNNDQQSSANQPAMHKNQRGACKPKPT
jgi:hypothetical protein